MGDIDDIQTVLKPLQKIEYIFTSERNERKFLLTVIYGSPRRHSNSLKTFKKSEKKLKKNYEHFFRTS